LALQAYPEADTTLIDLDLEQQFELLIGTIRTIQSPGRGILNRGEGDGDFTKWAQEREILTTGQSYIQDLAKVELLTITDSLDTDIEPASAVIGTRYKY